MVLQPKEERREPWKPEIMEATVKETLEWEAGLTDDLHILDLSLEHWEDFENKV